MEIIKKMRIMKIKIILSIIFVIIAIYITVNNTRIGITKYYIYSDKIKEDVVITQVSDLHNTDFGAKQKILIKKIKETKPDIIAVTGDIIDSNNMNIIPAWDFIYKANDIAPIYYVTGNHEAWIGSKYDNLKDKISISNVTVLDGKVINTKINNNELTILGIDDPSFENVDKQLDKLEYTDENFILLLAHRPELFGHYQNRNIDLVLTGHAHGGQFRIPSVGGVIAPNQGLFPKYTEGIFKSDVDNTKMIVSRGLGNSVIPIRINNNPELVVVVLKPKKD